MATTLSIGGNRVGNRIGLKFNIRGDMMVLRSVPIFVGLGLKHLFTNLSTNLRDALQVVRVTVFLDNVNWEIIGGLITTK